MNRWSVQAGLISNRELCDYIKKFDGARPVETLLGDPSIAGRFFYTSDLSSVNFVRRSGQISSTLETLLTHVDDPAKTVVMSCAEAAKQSIKCRLTDAGPVEVPVTLQTFKEALAGNGVSCDIGQIRLIGLEDHMKRYVVEYLCANQAKSAIAFIPLAGNSNPYESLDCATALSNRDVTCTFSSN
jgi:hypothetical protein